MDDKKQMPTRGFYKPKNEWCKIADMKIVDGKERYLVLVGCETYIWDDIRSFKELI